MIRLRSEVTRIMVAIEASDDSPLFRFLDALAWLVSAVRWLVYSPIRVLDRLAAAVVAVEVWCLRWSMRWQVTVILCRVIIGELWRNKAEYT